jgi:hypothetical protein
MERKRQTDNHTQRKRERREYGGIETQRNGKETERQMKRKRQIDKHTDKHTEREGA